MDNYLACPDCDSTQVIVYETSALFVNELDLYCHSVKAHDIDAPVKCLKCEWTGIRSELIAME